MGAEGLRWREVEDRLQSSPRPIRRATAQVCRTIALQTGACSGRLICAGPTLRDRRTESTG